MQKMTLHCTRASVRSANATHGVSQVSGALRRCNAAGISAMHPRRRLQRRGPGCAVAMQAISCNATRYPSAFLTPLAKDIVFGRAGCKLQSKSAMQLRSRSCAEPRTESGVALQRHDSWRSVRAPSRCVRSSDVGRARRTLRHAHRVPCAVEPARRSCS